MMVKGTECDDRRELRPPSLPASRLLISSINFYTDHRIDAPDASPPPPRLQRLSRQHGNGTCWNILYGGIWLHRVHFRNGSRW